ncbi:MAG: chromosomal replication initiator protein DnaA [Thermodesulfovibrionales bacterium]|nr:chromosomal replication initiator protein DnaA [Thermodesulfovibrionales bacterium]
MEEEKLWQKSLSAIEEKVGASTFELWFKPIRLIQIKEGQATIEVPNRFFKEWIEDYHPALISETIGSLMPESAGRNMNMAVKYNIAEKQATGIKRMDARLESRRTKLAGRGIYLNPKYTFGNFIAGPSNQFAQAAARAVADSPGSAYNPLFVYGGVGLGKTHLISAVGNYVADKRPDCNILYVSSEQFTSEVVFAFRNSKTEELKSKYRNLDLLLIDDVQLLENKTATQEELFHTLNVLYERQKQIVLSSDRPPKEIKSITDRLRSRFGMGLIADIQPPDIETKIAIIEKKAEMERITLPGDVVHFLASKVKSNIRDLEGCLIRLGAHSSLTGSPVDLPAAKSILRDFIQEDDRALTADAIAKAVAEYFGLKLTDMRAMRRTKDIAIPRQVAMYLSRELTETSLSEIGRCVGGKNHATVIYACKQVEAKRAQDENFNRMIENLIIKLKP